MPAPSPIRDVLQAIGAAIAREMVRLLNTNGRYPLRPNSALAKQLLSGDAVKVRQGRTGGGQFAGYTADSRLELFALDYAQWLNTGRKPGARKVPISALLTFIKNRNLRGRDKKSGKFLESNRLAFMIQNAIYKNGIRGRHFIEPAFAMGQELVDIYLNNQLLDGLTYELEQTLNFI
jgi:hypothetical protein